MPQATPIRVLHLFSNWKLTGPAEPAVNLAAECARSGLDITFICGRAPRGRKGRLHDAADRAGLKVDTPLTLSKHLSPIRNRLDASKLAKLLADLRPQVLHCHMQNDTRIALAAVRKIKERPAVVRTIYEGSPADIPSSALRMLRRVDGLIAVSKATADYAASDMKIGSNRTAHINSGVDLGRFSPANTKSSLRQRWGIGENVPVIGVVARIQARRRFDLLFQAFKQLLVSRADAVLVVVGRGTRKREVAEVPIHEMGIEDNVVLAGYLEGQDYVDALGSFDVLVYLVPGTDGSCRTVREAMAMGLPVVSSRRGMLPELVEDGVTGTTADENPQALRDAMESVLGSAENCSAMGKRAMEKSSMCFSLAKQAEETVRFYKRIL